MMNNFSAENLRQDTHLLRSTLLKLAIPRLLTRVAVVLATVAVWLWLCSTILQRGRTVRYDGFEAFGPQVVDFLVRINPYIWWGVVLILSLCVLGGLRGWLRRSYARGRAATVPLGVVTHLAASLSPEALDVLRWIWEDKEVPITVGMLYATLRQMRTGRINKMALARAQKAVLDRAAEPPQEPLYPQGPTPGAPAGPREPTLFA
ncbi:MAG: hypothetical protein WCP99_02830 [Burkholderiales bacterium]